MKGVLHHIAYDLAVDPVDAVIFELELLLAKHAEFVRLFGA